MNKIMNPKELLGAVSFIPETAPFDEEQRAWLNGFFAGLTGIEERYGESSSNGATALVESSIEEEEEEDFPWHDDSLMIDERMELAKDRPQKRQLMAAMAQLDCGTCGYLCQTYAEAIDSGAEDNLTLCSPGGKETARAIKKLVKLGGVSGDKPAAGAAEETGFTRKNPYPAKLIKSAKLTADGSAKDVRHVEIDLSGSGLEYVVGDSLGVFPTNCPELVDDILARCQTNGQIDATREASADQGSQRGN